MNILKLILIAMVISLACALFFPLLNKPASFNHTYKTNLNFAGTETPAHTTSEIEKMIEANKDDPEFLKMVGNIYFDKGKYHKAIEIYNRVLELNPEDADVLTDAGIAYREIGNPQKAIEYFKKAMDVDPQHPLSRYNLGIVLENDLGDLSGALQAFKEFLIISPDHPRRGIVQNKIKSIEEKLNEKSR